jgi:hypothetical protein
MSNIGIAANVSQPLGSCPGASPANYHSQVQTIHLYGGDFFTPGAIPEPSPMPESHSP